MDVLIAEESAVLSRALARIVERRSRGAPGRGTRLLAGLPLADS